MKCVQLSVILFAIFAVSQCDEESDDMKRKWNALMLKALKRKFGDSYVEGPGDECAKACQDVDMPGKDAVKKLQDPNKPKSELITEIYNTQFFTEMCSFFTVMATCLRSCPDTQRREFLRQVFAPIKFICEESQIAQNADCVGGVYENVTVGCLTETCQGQTGAAVLMFSMYSEAEQPTKENAEGLLSAGCGVMKCMVQCTREQRTRKCGAKADTDVTEFYKRLSKSLEDIRYLTPRDYVVDIPAECKVAS